MLSRGSGCLPDKAGKHLCPALPGLGPYPKVSHSGLRKPGRRGHWVPAPCTLRLDPTALHSGSRLRATLSIDSTELCLFEHSMDTAHCYCSSQACVCLPLPPKSSQIPGTQGFAQSPLDTGWNRFQPQSPGFSQGGDHAALRCDVLIALLLCDIHQLLVLASPFIPRTLELGMSKRAVEGLPLGS